jgi:TetR/AcrR family transcriptional regulator, ethionamide resistance regulator
MRYAELMSVLSRRTRTEQTRRVNEDALLTATVTLLDKGSAFADLGIEQIVREAGLSRPTFYTYFRDKRDLVLRLGGTLEQELVAVAEPWFSGAPVSASATITAVLGVFRRQHAAVRAIIEAATYDADVAAFWQTFHDRFLPRATQRIAAGNPELDREAVAARAYALIYMTERTLIEHLGRAQVSDDALVEQLTWFWERAVGD